MMDNYALPFWVYLAALTVFVCGAMKRILAFHLSVGPTLMAWLGATLLVEQLWVFCMPVLLLLALLGLACYLYSACRTGPPQTALSGQGKTVFITGKRTLCLPALPLSEVCRKVHYTACVWERGGLEEP